MSNLTQIDILGERLKLLQPENGFRLSVDAVFLAAACPIKSGQTLLDMGCGVGNSGLCVMARVDDIHLTGIDVQPFCIETITQNADLNNFSDRTNFILSDIREHQIDPAQRYDHIICNPPYMEAGKHITSPTPHKAISNGHLDDDISIRDWVKSGLNLLKSKGSLTLIHRADATDSIIRAMGKSFGQIEIIPIFSKSGSDAKRVIIRAIKDRQTPCIIRSGLIVHEQDGNYTARAQDILRHAKPLSQGT